MLIFKLSPDLNIYLSDSNDLLIFSIALQDGNTVPYNAKIAMHTGVEGGNITVKCSFYIFGKWKLLCKDQCERGNILIETADLVAQRGRYFIKYKEEEFPTRHAVFYVSITQLEKSDSGLYRCYLDRDLDPYLFDSFQLTVTEGEFLLVIINMQYFHCSLITSLHQ